jgi:hypothetical protein
MITRTITNKNTLPCLDDGIKADRTSSNLGISSGTMGGASTGTGSAAKRNSGGTTTLVWQYWQIMVG